MQAQPPLVLHIGYPRTATTLFQTALQKYNPGIMFLGRAVEGRDGGRWLADELNPLWEWIRLGRGSANLDEARSLIDSLLARGQGEGKACAAISDETMSKPHRLNWHAGMVERLQGVFPEADILLTLRSQTDIIASMYGLYVGRSLRSDLPLLTFGQWFFQGGGSSYVPLAERFDYAAMYKPLLEAFGKDRIHVLLFEEFQSDPKAYLSKLAGILRCPDFDMHSDRSVNASPDLRRDVRFKRKASGGLAARLYDKKWLSPLYGLLDKLLLSDKHIQWDQYTVDEESKRVIAHLFYESNDRFADMSGIDLTAAGYPTLANLREKYIYYRQ